MRMLAALFLLALAACWVTPQEVDSKIAEFEPLESADTGLPPDTGS
ncbi:MAG: hypothetical protein AAF602_05440 [Myxococcota bacterium]